MPGLKFGSRHHLGLVDPLQQLTHRGKQLAHIYRRLRVERPPQLPELARRGGRVAALDDRAVHVGQQLAQPQGGRAARPPPAPPSPPRPAPRAAAPARRAPPAAPPPRRGTRRTARAGARRKAHRLDALVGRQQGGRQPAAGRRTRVARPWRCPAGHHPRPLAPGRQPERVRRRSRDARRRRPARPGPRRAADRPAAVAVGLDHAQPVLVGADPRPRGVERRRARRSAARARGRRRARLALARVDDHRVAAEAVSRRQVPVADRLEVDRRERRPPLGQRLVELPRPRSSAARLVRRPARRAARAAFIQRSGYCQRLRKPSTRIAPRGPRTPTGCSRRPARRRRRAPSPPTAARRCAATPWWARTLAMAAVSGWTPPRRR